MTAGNRRKWRAVAALLGAACAGCAASEFPERSYSGPVQVRGAGFVDAAGKPVLLRGTQVPGLSAGGRDFGTLPGHRYGALSATTFNAIRKRWNMNVVRLPVDVTRYLGDPSYPARLERAVQNAHRQDLLVILSAEEPGVDFPSEQTRRFWTQCAAGFRNDSRMLFDVASAPRASAIPGHVPGLHSGADWRFWLRGGTSAAGGQAIGMQALFDAIRATGAAQPVIVTGLEEAPLLEGLTPEFLLVGDGVVYGTNLPFNTVKTDAERERYFGFLADRVPVMVNDWDLHLDREECRELPGDPGVVERIVESGLDYFDRRRISWTISTYAPEKLVSDYRHYFATTIDNGLPCGSAAGIGTMVQYHLIKVPLRGMVTTSLNATFVLARGAAGQAYGPILGDEDTDGQGALPTRLSNISVQIVDSGGVARWAPLLHVGAGWAFVNFVIPPEVAKGPATVSVLRADGSKTESHVLIDDVSPALLTGHGIGWGPVIGIATQAPAAGAARTFPIYDCGPSECKTIPIPMGKNVSTTVRLLGTGFRNAKDILHIKAEIGGMPVPVLSFGPAEGPGADQVTVRLPLSLRGIGETDLMLTVNGRPANVVRINCGSK